MHKCEKGEVVSSVYLSKFTQWEIFYLFHGHSLSTYRYIVVRVLAIMSVEFHGGRQIFTLKDPPI